MSDDQPLPYPDQNGPSVPLPSPDASSPDTSVQQLLSEVAALRQQVVAQEERLQALEGQAQEQRAAAVNLEFLAGLLIDGVRNILGAKHDMTRQHLLQALQAWAKKLTGS